jgi:hemolysin III
MIATDLPYDQTMSASPSQYSVREEIVHALTHGFGVLLSVVGLSWMLYISIAAADPWRIVASTVYGAALIALFLASTVYHSMYASRHREIFKLLDHCAIYTLIAGTYTPFLLVAMRSNTGWVLFGTIWALATAGIVKKLWFRDRFPKVALASYLAMGWLIVVAAPQMAEAIGPNGMAWVVAGGISYSVGAIFYAFKRIPFNHAIWHVFVLGGGICHFLGVIWYVLPG